MIENRDYREHYLKAERSAEQRRKDLVVAFDQIYDLKRSDDRKSIMLWILGAVVTAEGCAIGWLLTELFSRI